MNTPTLQLEMREALASFHGRELAPRLRCRYRSLIIFLIHLGLEDGKNELFKLDT
jgi:hypothetical protein